MQPYQATKTYRCPGCDHEIAPRRRARGRRARAKVDERRHWHRACWERADADEAALT